jgi:hypothetical protein
MLFHAVWMTSGATSPDHSAHISPTQRQDPKPKKKQNICTRAYLGDILLRPGHHVIIVVGDRDLVWCIYVVAPRPQPVKHNTVYRQLVVKPITRSAFHSSYEYYCPQYPSKQMFRY